VPKYDGTTKKSDFQSVDEKIDWKKCVIVSGMKVLVEVP
jgi:hypothetical protein